MDSLRLALSPVRCAACGEVHYPGQRCGGEPEAWTEALELLLRLRREARRETIREVAERRRAMT